jgi:hypothetical protein
MDGLTTGVRGPARVRLIVLSDGHVQILRREWFLQMGAKLLVRSLRRRM